MLACDATARGPVTDWPISGTARRRRRFRPEQRPGRRDLHTLENKLTGPSRPILTRGYPSHPGGSKRVGPYRETRKDLLSFSLDHAAADKSSD